MSLRLVFFVSFVLFVPFVALFDESVADGVVS